MISRSLQDFRRHNEDQSDDYHFPLCWSRSKNVGLDLLALDRRSRSDLTLSKDASVTPSGSFGDVLPVEEGTRRRRRTLERGAHVLVVLLGAPDVTGRRNATRFIMSSALRLDVELRRARVVRLQVPRRPPDERRSDPDCPASESCPSSAGPTKTRNRLVKKERNPDSIFVLT